MRGGESSKSTFPIGNNFPPSRKDEEYSKEIEVKEIEFPVDETAGRVDSLVDLKGSLVNSYMNKH
jgi:hypothetical protein